MGMCQPKVIRLWRNNNDSNGNENRSLDQEQSSKCDTGSRPVAGRGKGNGIGIGMGLSWQSIDGVLSERVGERWYSLLVLLWVLAGSTMALWSFYSMTAETSRRRQENLANMCDERARMLQEQFVASMNHVRALTVLVSTFHLEMHPSALYQEVFAAYTARTAFERPLMSGVAYAQRVLHSQRDAFEKMQGWTIKRMHTKDIQPPQEEYAPTIFSQETVSYLISLDMMSGKEDRENILRARESGKGALTSPFRLLDSNHLGVVFTFAVYDRDLSADAKPEQRTEVTVGYLGGAFDVESLVENLLRQLAGSLAIIVNVYDTTNKSFSVLMYGSGTMVSNGYHVSDLDFGDPYRKHEMRCRFADDPKLPFSAIRTFLGMLVIVLLVGHILFAAINRIKKVEEDFREMEELKGRAEAADVAKSQFLATVSHEIRTPMNGVLGMLQMLMDTNLDATQKDYAQTAQASGKALITLINEVLDQAKIESGRLELETVPFHVRTVLDSVLSLFSAKTQAKGIELAVFVSERVPEVVIGDPGRFQQIITNLVCNSVKFTEQGHIFVCVRLAEEVSVLTERLSSIQKFTGDAATNNYDSSNTLSGSETADGRNNWESFKLLLNNDELFCQTDEKGQIPRSTDVKLAINVEDTGIGIPLHAQDRVFTPFMQADSSTSRTYGGTGIGLSISRCLIELMGGEISFISRPGIGSTFSFTAFFKLGQASVASDNELLRASKLPTQFRGMKALVLDGKPVRSLVTKYHLQRFGIEVDTITSAQLALSMLNGMDGFPQEGCSVKDGIDMVLIEKDAWGPGTGLLFPSQVRVGLFPRGPFLQSKGLLKMILLATSLTAEETQKAKAAGFAETVILKPLRASMLAVCLQLALGFCKRREQIREPSKASFPLCNVLSGKHLLVVDDNIVNRRVAAGALKKYGANVICTDSGKSAISLLQPPHNFDACFMDVQMPEMDGFEATRQIRAAELVNMKHTSDSGEMQLTKSRWHVPILAMTADVIQATHEECLRCGMDGYVSKPFEEEQLYKALAQFFGNESSIT
eukprot:Gb_05953 [translate_table: standard]